MRLAFCGCPHATRPAAEEVQRASNAWIDGRTKVLDMFKAGTRSILLVFSDQDGGNALRFPWYQRFAQWVEPWLLQVRRGACNACCRVKCCCEACLIVTTAGLSQPSTPAAVKVFAWSVSFLFCRTGQLCPAPFQLALTTASHWLPLLLCCPCRSWVQ
jgi:hypothetical protein